MSSFAEIDEQRKTRTAAGTTRELQAVPRELSDLAGALRQGGRDRRKHDRHRSQAIVEIIRESDSRRISLPVELVDVSITGLGLITVEPFTPDDRVKIKLRNDLRKFLKETHGIVRWSQLTPEGEFRIGIELTSRFSALDMQLLKQVGLAGGAREQIWV